MELLEGNPGNTVHIVELQSINLPPPQSSGDSACRAGSAPRSASESGLADAKTARIKA